MWAYDLQRNNRHYNHTLRGKDQYTCFYYKLRPMGNQNRLSILVYNLGMDHQNNSEDMSMILHFLELYNRRWHRMVMVHKD